MASLTADRDTPRREGEIFEFEAGAEIFAGAMVCVNGSGKAVPAAKTAGLSPVMGVADNHAQAGQAVFVRRGVFQFDGQSDSAPAGGEMGKTVYAEDDHTVRKTSETSAPQAGILVGSDANGVWIKI